MRKIIAVLVTIALLSGMLPVVSARADFEAPPPLSDPSSPAEGAKPQQQQSGRSKVKGGKIVAKVVVCGGGKLMLGAGRPVPLKKMSKRQWRQFRVIQAQYDRARLAWGLGCPAIPNIALGVIGPVAFIAADDFRLRFITRELPIKRTARQEQLLFCRDGSSPCPKLVGVDPDLYGPR